MSHPIYQGHQASFSRFPPIVKEGELGFIVRDLETIIVLFLFALRFIYLRLHNSQMFPKLRFWDCNSNSNA